MKSVLCVPSSPVLCVPSSVLHVPSSFVTSVPPSVLVCRHHLSCVCHHHMSCVCHHHLSCLLHTEDGEGWASGSHVACSSACYHEPADQLNSYMSRADSTGSLTARAAPRCGSCPTAGCPQRLLCHVRAPGRAAGRAQWHFAREAAYFLAALVPGQQGADPLPWEPPLGWHHRDAALGNRIEKKVWKVREEWRLMLGFDLPSRQASLPGGGL